MYQYKATIVRAVDADTIILDIDLGFSITVRERVRLARINAPELSTEEGKRARDFVKQFEGAKVVVETQKTDRYGRYVGEVKVDGKSLSDLLLEQGLAKHY